MRVDFGVIGAELLFFPRSVNAIPTTNNRANQAIHNQSKCETFAGAIPHC